MKRTNKRKDKSLSCVLQLGKYSKYFELLKMGEIRCLKDRKSNKDSHLPVKICEEEVYLTEPDGKLISNIQNQQKCDFLIVCGKQLQTCFVELKGENISNKSGYNPYGQIIDTINFLQNEEELEQLASGNTEKHAFIVSPGRQKIPKGIELKERQLWQKIVQPGKAKLKISDLVHYVKVTKTDRYSNKNQIICSPKSPVQFPFHCE